MLKKIYLSGVNGKDRWKSGKRRKRKGKILKLLGHQISCGIFFYFCDKIFLL